MAECFTQSLSVTGMKSKRWTVERCTPLKMRHFNSTIKRYLSFWSNSSQLLSSGHGGRESPKDTLWVFDSAANGYHAVLG